MNTKEPVKIRTKEIKDGMRSVYLDIYCDGKRTYEFLKLYLLPDTSRYNKAENKKTMMLAETAKAERIVEIQSGRFNIKQKNNSPKIIDFCNKIMESKREGTRAQYQRIMPILEKIGGNKYVNEINEKFVDDFKQHLDNLRNERDTSTLKIVGENTKTLLFTKFKHILNKAVREGYINQRISSYATNYKMKERERSYLTIEELQIMVDNMPEGESYRAFVFSCFTGLRKSDIINLTWDNITKNGEFKRIVFKQKKTKGFEYLDLSTQAEMILGEHKNGKDKVFPFKYSSHTNVQIRKWAEKCGIHKHITFHSARHTFAVMMLTLDVDIYTTSKLLGHRELKTTQVYAKIIDKKKQEAVAKIPIKLK